MIKKLCFFSLLGIIGLFAFRGTAYADSVDQSYLSLGADLSSTEKAEVLRLLGVDDADLDEYMVVTVTNADEHTYLDDYLSSSVIGSRALSSCLIEKTDEGNGINVTTKNITYCTSGMYENALSTAGIADADVTVAGPFNISGTAALVGAMNAYEDMTGEDISEDSKDAATNELVVTSELADAIDDPELAEQIVAFVKEKVVSADLDSQEDIKEIIEEGEEEFDVDLTEDQEQQIIDLMEKISKLDLDIDELKQQAANIYDQLKQLNINTGGILQAIQGFFSRNASFFGGGGI